MKKPVTLNKLRDKAQKVFNAFIRTRDQDKGCISCGGPVEQAGHYYNAGQYTGLRFNEVNTNGQCIACNYHRHGNLLHYRNGILNKYGQQALDLLDSAATRNRVHRWNRVELEFIYQKYLSLNTGKA